MALAFEALNSEALKAAGPALKLGPMKASIVLGDL